MSEQNADEAALKEVENVIALLVKSGLDAERSIKLEHGSTLASVLEIFAVERGCLVGELIIVREGVELPLSPSTAVDDPYPHHIRHHVHGVGLVDVIVFYGAKEHRREFKRQATVDDVLTWAIKVFGIDPSMAGEFELARHGHKEELPGTEHIGHLAGHHHELKLDLVRGDIANGSGA